MNSYRSLPLAFDVGAARLRIALAEASREGDVRVVAIASRDVPEGAASSTDIARPDLIAAIVDDALAELGTRERRAVFAIGHPAAIVRTMQVPKMSWSERTRAARFEAQRFVTWDMEEEATIVRVHCVDRAEGTFAVGAVQARALASRMALAKACRVKVAGIDHDAFALRRAMPLADAIVDIGCERTLVHAYTPAGPLSWTVPAGGAEITRAIARELHLDAVTAEKRKRILGAAGAGDSARDGLVAQVAAAIDRARARGVITRIALTGNGSRLPGIAPRLEHATGAIVESPVPTILQGDVYQDDVLRSAAPDWTLTAGLLSWSVAA